MRYFTSPRLAFCAAALVASIGNASAGPPAPAERAAAAKLFEKQYLPLPMKKGGSEVALAYQLQGPPEIGRSLTIKIMMLSAADAQVVVRADEGLQLQSSGLVMQSTAGVAAEHQLAVTPLASGRFYLHVMSTANGRTSASAIAVQVGADKLMRQAKPSGAIHTMPNGERIISTPAQ